MLTKKELSQMDVRAKSGEQWANDVFLLLNENKILRHLVQKKAGKKKLDKGQKGQ